MTPTKQIERLRAALESAAQRFRTIGMGCAEGFWAQCGEGRATLDIARMGEDDVRAALSATVPPADLEVPGPGPTDTAMLDWLESRRLALNAHYGTSYGWELVLNHNVNRLFVGSMCLLDLNDARANAGDIRAALRKAMPSVAAPEAQGSGE